MIDFEIPEDARVVRNKVRKFVQEECHPAEEVCTADNFEDLKETALFLGQEWECGVFEVHSKSWLRAK